ncbi:hypothetical protein SAMN02910456_01918 [Ruminococcaceae bacterium YRB3002]|nr:hypothetical protein SAMN02910456_01918 [Ruminococcaceae bacterium YRB3002]
MKKSVKFLSVLLSVVLFASSSLTILMMPKGNVRADEFNEEQIEGPAEPDPNPLRLLLRMGFTPSPEPNT